MPLMRGAGFTVIVILLGGCGLTLDLDPPDPDGGTSSDAGPGGMDADVADGGVDAGDCSADDDDADGLSECDGDCDDADPDVYPGAPLICGDGVNNDCPARSAGEDLECLGVFVATDGSDTAAGTPTAPLLTVTEGLARAMAGAAPSVYVAAGEYASPRLTMVSGVSVRGGFDRATWRRDRAQETVLRIGSAEGLEFPSDVRRGTVLQGVTVQNSSSTSATTVTIRGEASPLIRDCVIIGGDNGLSVAVGINIGARLEVASGARIEASRIELGEAPGLGAAGIHAVRADVTIVATRVVLADGVAVQNGIHLQNAPTARLDRVIVAPDEGDPSLTPSGQSAGVLVEGGGVSIDASALVSGPCVDNCFGLKVEFPTAPVTITNSRITADAGQTFAAGMLLKLGDTAGAPSIPPILVHSNFLAGGASSPATRGDGLLLDLEGPGPAIVGRFLNNIFWCTGHTGSVTVREVAQPGANIQPVAFHNNALFSLSGGVGVYVFEDGATGDVDTVNATDWADLNLLDSCEIAPYATPPDFRLPADSNCIGAGTSDDVPDHDCLDQPRPVGAPDIGPDEYQGP